MHDKLRFCSQLNPKLYSWLPNKRPPFILFYISSPGSYVEFIICWEIKLLHSFYPPPFLKGGGGEQILGNFQKGGLAEGPKKGGVGKKGGVTKKRGG